MATLTHEDVRVVLGPVDDTLVAEIVATDASPEELAELERLLPWTWKMARPVDT